jgi:hypothetical protein
LHPIDIPLCPATIPHSIGKEAVLKRAVLLAIPALIIGIAVVLAQPIDLDESKPYEFKLDKDITADAADVVIEPKFAAVVKDRFGYEAYFNATRTGTVTEAGKTVETFRHVENWIDVFTLVVAEDPIDGHKDPLLRFQFDLIEFTVDNGDARYTGYIGATQGNKKPSFQEVLPDGKRSDVTNIPGWAGINASSIEMNRNTQARDFSATASFSVADTGRVYRETYFADWVSGDQTNYPGRLQDPLHLALGTQPEFAAGTKLKLGESVVVRRRMPVGATFGGTVEYDVTYKLEKLYGTKEKPTAARLTFDAVPVQRNHAVVVNGLNTEFTAPDIKGGRLLLDLVKGVAAHVQWAYTLTGTVNQAGSQLATKFEVKLDYSASLRASKETTE